MKHLKRTLALLLAVVMLIGIVPIAAEAGSAVTYNPLINYVEIYGGMVPRVGEKPMVSHSVHTFDEKKYQMESTPEWYEIQENAAARKMSLSETYQKSHSYFLKVKVKSIVKSGAPFDSYWFEDASQMNADFVVCRDNNASYRTYIYTGTGDANRERTIMFLFRFDDTRPLVIFDAGGGIGFMEPRLASSQNYLFKVPQCSFTNGSLIFKQWKNMLYTNSFVSPGASLHTENTTLQAVWKTDNSDKTAVSAISLTGGALPQFDQHPTFNWSISSGDSAKMQISSMSWQNNATSKVLTSNDTFEIGYYYHLYLVIKAKDGYYFTPKDEASITATLQSIAPSRYGFDYYLVENGITANFTFLCARPYLDADVRFPRPFPGNTATAGNVIVSGTNSSKLKSDTVQWYLGGTVNSPGSKLATTATFEAAKTYIAEIKLYGRDWSGDIKQDASVTYAGHFPMTFIKRVNENGIFVNYYRIRFDVPANGSQLKSMVQTLDLPQAGGHPSDKLYVTSSQYATDFVSWYTYENGTRGTKISADSTFSSGQKYVAVVTVTAAPNTYFGSNASLTINSVKAKAFGTLSSYGSRSYEVILGTLPFYTVTFNSNGGTDVDSQTVVQGERIAKPVNPTKSGYNFDGWYTNAGLTSVFNFSTTILSNRTLYAKWTPVEVHKHSYSILNFNDNFHWYECTCGDKNIEIAHVYDNDSDATCNVCGYERSVAPQHTHDYSILSCNADYHWYECNCGDKVSFAEHVYDNNSDTTCNVCGMVRSISQHVHNYNTLRSNADYHWYECTCGDKVSFEEHVYDSANDTTCNVCGYKREVSDHQHNYIDMIVSADEYDVGYTMHYCEGCGASYTDTYTAPTAKLSLKCAARTAAAEKLGWKKVGNANGYQVQISTKDGKKWSTYATLKNNATVSYTFKKLAAGYNYKFRVRFYITVDGKNYFSPWSKTFQSPTLPSGTSVSKISGSSKAFTANWKKNTAVTGYQVQYSLKSDFSGAKTVTMKSNKTLKATVKKLGAKKVYYVRVRTYKTIAKVNYFSTWSKTVKVKTK